MQSEKNFFAKKKKWSELKDTILKNYLKPYIAKISKTNRPLTIIDCFAGKGKFDDSSQGSPIIIMEQIKNFKTTNNLSQINAIFIESKYYEDLNYNLKDYDDFKILKGTFEENIFSLLKINADNNLFIYIDPYGFKSLDFSYFTKLVEEKFNSLEILLNFNSIGFLREACRVFNYSFDQLEEDSDEDYEIEEALDIKKMKTIANGDYWIKIISDFKNGLINFNEAEEKFIENYTAKLKLLFSYIIKIPIKTKFKNIPKYRIIFITNHPDGLILMSDNMSKIWKNIVDSDKEGQESLFNIFELYDKGLESIEDKIKRILKKKNSKVDLETLYLELIDYYEGQFSIKEYKNKIIELENKGLIEIKREPEYTKTGKICKSFDYKQKKIDIILKRHEG